MHPAAREVAAVQLGDAQICEAKQLKKPFVGEVMQTPQVKKSQVGQDHDDGRSQRSSFEVWFVIKASSCSSAAEAALSSL